MIPVFNLTRIHKTIAKELKESFLKTIEGGVFILGKNVEKFEKEFASYTGCEFGIGVGSGTEALSLGMQALNINPGDEVVLPANAYPTIFSITAIGAIPHPVDIVPDTFNMDPKKLEEAIETDSKKGKKIKGIIVVHMYGRPADIISIKKITAKYRIPLIEDCAHAHGAKMGTYGDVSCFSFYPTKNLGALGDGGIVLTDNPQIAEKVKLLRMYGEKNRYESIFLGRNSRLDEVQAGFLSVKLKYLDKWNRERQKIAKWYERYLFTNKTDLIRNTPYSPQCVYHLFVIRTAYRDSLKAYLESHHIGTGIHYPTSVHLVPSMRFLGYGKGDFPQSEKASEEVLSLPLWPGMKEKEVELVANKICTFFENVVINSK